MTATLVTADSKATQPHQQRLRSMVKQLVIELGYLEHALEGSDLNLNLNLQTASLSLDTAIDCLNEELG